MDSQEIDRLAQKALDDLRSGSAHSRVVIGIAGVPGSGKTTLATAVASRINQIQGSAEDLAVSIPMDGFHYSRKHLANMPNAEEAIHRRGAAFTFNGEGFFNLVQSLVNSPTELIYAPSFHHEIKDPVANSIPIPPSARIVLIEGNYCALDEAPWRDAAALMTRLWYADAPAEVAHSRLAPRHLASGIVADEREAWKRATGTDELNAQHIRTKLLKVDEIIKSG
ncbi:unnamed protein product [Clonostachys byssicola]|uniref:Phosphoribulokinase/uridine kinase domain-containing protein n=1 Tax=Clonostachys byssicola TaxID=160290 RepID=A0A9N9Y5F4_9HYPO|nr:unnamed protein product [Clonostachys byssicola]